MARAIARSLLGIALLALATAAAGAEVVTVNSILIAHRAGATADGIIAVVANPDNSIAMTADDVVTLRAAGVPGNIVTAIEARLASPPPPRGSLKPDDPRLVDLVRLSTSGISESIIAEQVRQSNPAYELSVADLLYLKENGVLESIIASLMATHPAGQAAPGGVGTSPAVPQQIAFDDLVLVRPGFMKKSRPGRLVMSGDTLAWVDAGDPEDNFEFQITGLEKVWFTCQARTPENFCHQINFQIVKGHKYRFRDANQESGENVAVLNVMEALRKHFPQAAFGSPDA